jgi:hypothetical protein
VLGDCSRNTLEVVIFEDHILCKVVVRTYANILAEVCTNSIVLIKQQQTVCPPFFDVSWRKPVHTLIQFGSKISEGMTFSQFHGAPLLTAHTLVV